MVYLKTCLPIGLYLLLFAEFNLAEIQKGKKSINMLKIKEDKQSYRRLQKRLGKRTLNYIREISSHDKENLKYLYFTNSGKMVVSFRLTFRQLSL